MKKSYKYIFVAVFFLSLGMSACNDFLDVNVDPNNPPTSTPALTLPAAEGELAYILGNQFQFMGNFFAQHWAQSGGANQYCTLEQYQMTSSSYDGRVWGELYAGALEDFEYVAEQGAENNNPNYTAIGLIMQAYTFEVITDAWGDVPFTSALAGLDELNPTYQSQQEIYDGLIPMLDSAIAQIDAGGGAVGSNDLVYGGDMELWRRFANTLKLRIYLRQAYVRPDVAQAGVQQLYANGAEFLGMGETAEIVFADQTQNRNPFYQTQVVFRGGVDVVASNTALNYLQNTDDPRLDEFYAPAETGSSAGQFVGVDQGTECTPGRTGTLANALSKPGPAVASATTAVPFLSAAESFFLQAEAAARGWTNGTADAAALYEQGIRASFNYLGLGEAAVADLLAQEEVAYPAGAPVEGEGGQIDQIITQKWLSFSGTQGFEAWTEYRRTGYPSFIEPSAASTLSGSQLPRRILYPNTESIRNTNYPGLKEIDVPVWWDVKD